MSKETRRSGTERFKYGICLNDDCEKCKNKEIQQIPMRKEFVCEECGKELRECPSPKSSNSKPMIFGLAAVVIIGAVVGGIFAFSGGSEEKSEIVTDSIPAVAESMQVAEAKLDTVVKTDTVVVRDTIAITTTEKADTKTAANTSASGSKSNSGSLHLGYADYSGATKNGKAHGQGRMTFSSSHAIDSRDPKGRVADAGDYVIGEWNDGKLVQGRWYGSDGNVKGSIIIGM